MKNSIIMAQSRPFGENRTGGLCNMGKINEETFNMMSVIHTASTAVKLTRSIARSRG